MTSKESFIITTVICASLYSAGVSFIDKLSVGLEAKRFCAYNRVFVEFKEGNTVWGTMLLDFEGRPIPCREEAEPVEEHTTYNNRNLI